MLKTELRQVCHELTSFSHRDALYISQPWYQCSMRRSWSTRGFSIFPAWCWKWSTWTVKSVRHGYLFLNCWWVPSPYRLEFNLQRRNWRSHTFPLTLKGKPSRKVLECGSIMVFLFFSGSSRIFPGSFWLFTILCISWVSSFTLCTASGGGFSFLPQVRWADVDFLECFPAVFPAVVLLFICLWICSF